jgi:hypothetical protein
MSTVALQFDGVLTKHVDFAVQPGVSGRVDVNLEDHRFDLEFSRSARYPNIVDRYFDFDSLYGNPDLGAENALGIHAGYLYDRSVWHFGLEGGYGRIENEIRWDGSRFGNYSTRDFSYAGLRAGFEFWKVKISGGGQYTFSEILLSPQAGGWGKLHFHDRWLGGALIVDGYLMLHYYDSHRNLRYEPRLERFYFTGGDNKPYSLLNWKVVGTIQEAEIFFEMDNSTASVFEVVDRYQEFYIRWRFGINWILWD